jgi:cytochrome c6
MKRLLLSLVVLSVAAAARADDGATVYAKRCAACHGKDGKGTPVGVKMGATDLAASKLSEPEMVGVIAGGRGKMTAFKEKLSEGEIKEVAKFVKGGLK